MYSAKKYEKPMCPLSIVNFIKSKDNSGFLWNMILNTLNVVANSEIYPLPHNLCKKFTHFLTSKILPWQDIFWYWWVTNISQLHVQLKVAVVMWRTFPKFPDKQQYCLFFIENSHHKTTASLSLAGSCETEVTWMYHVMSRSFYTS